MRRRDFVQVIVFSAAWSRVARAQQSALAVVGFLLSSSPAGFAQQIAAFRQSLREGGFIEGQNIAIEFRWAEDQYLRLPKLAAELVDRRVAVIFAGGGNISALAAKAATSAIPISIAPLPWEPIPRVPGGYPRLSMASWGSNPAVGF